MDDSFHGLFRSIWKITEEVAREQRFEFIHCTGAGCQGPVFSPIFHEEGDGREALQHGDAIPFHVACWSQVSA